MNCLQVFWRVNLLPHGCQILHCRAAEGCPMPLCRDGFPRTIPEFGAGQLGQVRPAGSAFAFYDGVQYPHDHKHEALPDAAPFRILAESRLAGYRKQHDTASSPGPIASITGPEWSENHPAGLPTTIAVRKVDRNQRHFFATIGNA